MNGRCSVGSAAVSPVVATACPSPLQVVRQASRHASPHFFRSKPRSYRALPSPARCSDRLPCLRLACTAFCCRGVASAPRRSSSSRPPRAVRRTSMQSSTDSTLQHRNQQRHSLARACVLCLLLCHQPPGPLSCCRRRASAVHVYGCPEPSQSSVESEPKP